MKQQYRITTMLGLAALAGAAYAGPADGAPRMDPCVDVPGVGDVGEQGLVPVLTTRNEVATVYIVYDGEGGLVTCPDVTATVHKTDGTHRQVVPFDGRGGTGMPPIHTILARIPIPLADGAGEWMVTKVTRGTVNLNVSVRFRIGRGTMTAIDQPATVNSPARTTVTGLVRRYTSTGAIAAAPAGIPVRIMHENGTSLIASTKTGTNGRYSVAVPFTVNTTMRAMSSATASYARSESGLVTAHIRASLVRLIAAPTVVVNTWWRIDGKAFPGRMGTGLEYWDGSAWIHTQSFGPSAADGTFTRWWKPTALGTFRLRVTIGRNGVDGSPIVREKTVTVTSKQTVPTYLDGVVRPTTDPVIRMGTKMSTFGHLKVRYSNGTVGPFANQRVLVQVRPLSDPEPGWYVAAYRQTTSSGYFYANWNVDYPGDAEVRLVYTSPYETIKDAQLGLGVIHVQ